MNPTQKNDSTPKMTTLSEAMNHAVKNGYTEDFKITEEGLTWGDEEIVYGPEQVTVSNFYRFEGYSDPDYNEILYLIETANGEKGTLTEAYGVYGDELTSTFLSQVEGVHKVQLPK